MAYILLLSLIGLGVSLYILFRKNKRQTILCIIGKDCNEVIKSKYSSFFGVRNEVLGTLYYILIILLSVLTLGNLILASTYLTTLIIASLVASAYSIYLTYVQFFALRKICGLCLMTNLLNILITGFAFFLFVGSLHTVPKMFLDVYAETGLINQKASKGASWADYDNDSDLDLLISGSPTRLYQNMGNQTFRDVTFEVGLNGIFSASGVFADYDNDGCLDLFLNVTKENDTDKLFEGNCKIFIDKTRFSKITSTASRGIAGAAWGDYDNDGLLDLYIAGHGTYATPETNWNAMFEPNLLYRNLGNGTFEEVSKVAGVTGVTECAEPRYRLGKINSVGGPLKPSFQPVWLDYNNDGYIDLFIATDGGVSPLYRNLGNGTFKESTYEAGLCRDGTGMGATVGDYDNNGTLDIYVTNVGVNYLWKNNGNGRFQEDAANAGIANPSTIGWGTSFIDFDNDGDSDLIIANGAIFYGESVKESKIGKSMEDKLYVNRQNLFTDLSIDLGIVGDDQTEGLAVGDYNNDGFEDVIVISGSRNAPVEKHRLYKNLGNDNNYITIRLVGTKSNRDGIGAKIKVITAGKTQLEQVDSGTSFLSQNSLWKTFGVGKSQKIDKIEIEWPSGIMQTLIDQEVNRMITIIEEK